MAGCQLILKPGSLARSGFILSRKMARSQSLWTAPADRAVAGGDDALEETETLPVQPRTKRLKRCVRGFKHAREYTRSSWPILPPTKPSLPTSRFCAPAKCQAGAALGHPVAVA